MVGVVLRRCSLKQRPRLVKIHSWHQWDPGQLSWHNSIQRPLRKHQYRYLRPEARTKKGTTYQITIPAPTNRNPTSLHSLTCTTTIYLPIYLSPGHSPRTRIPGIHYQSRTLTNIFKLTLDMLSEDLEISSSETLTGSTETISHDETYNSNEAVTDVKVYNVFKNSNCQL